jgi:hypothetical protein
VARALSIVVVTYDMARELPRTLHSLSAQYQRHIDADDYEIVVVDNGSPQPLDERLLPPTTVRLRTTRIDPAPPSPVRAANLGLEMAEGDVVGLIIDGARMASPGLLRHAMLATTVARRPVVATLGWHLGPVRHMDAAGTHDQASEDRLLAEIDWPANGYRLFEVATLAASSARGWFAPMGESSAIFMPQAMWRELEGLDERFSLPGGGLVNHDLYRRACELAGMQLIVVLGEGTFHQFHGGAATSRRLTWDEMQEDYQLLRGGRYRPPSNRPIYVGHLPPQAMGHVERSAQLEIERQQRRPGRE